jgi:ankyrin repeat protein
MKKNPRLLILVFVCSVVLFNCSNSQEKARDRLGRLNITYSENSFVERARDGDLEPVRLFLQAGMNPNVTNKTGQTALVVAARYGRPKVVQLLLANGADPDLSDQQFGATPLIWAAVGGFGETAAELLDRGASMHGKNGKV